MSKYLLPACLLSLMALAACSSDTVYETTAPSSYVRLSPTPPPLPIYEPVPPNPRPTLYLWRKGYWSYDGKEFKWVSGAYMPKPTSTAAWSPDRWDRHQFGWGFVPGHWE